MGRKWRRWMLLAKMIEWGCSWSTSRIVKMRKYNSIC